ncbi:transposase, partial [Escherichia coli]|nr:transposase [Escherichia coli]
FSDPGPVFHTIVSIKNDGHYFCRAGGNRPDGLNEPVTIGKRLYGILNAMRHRVSNGNAEALNSKIRLLRIKARGYRNRERFKLGVMFHYGKLNMAF